MIDRAATPTDEASGKGAVESDAIQTNPGSGQNSIAGQLGHRDQNEMLKDNDTDFPEPDAEAEHTGNQRP
jgi:hypothetical protein